MKNKGTQFLAEAAVIGAIYVVLTLLFAPLSYGEIQIRFSEALTILPFFTPAAIPGLFVGCIIANLFGGAIPVDIIFGSIATLIGAVFTYRLRSCNRFLAPIPPIVSNAVIVPFVLHFGYGVNLPIPLMMLTVGIGEVVSCGVVGFILFALYLLCVLKKVAFGIFNPNISTYGKCIMAFIPVWLVGELVESRIVLGMNFQAIIFWIMIGYVGYYTKERK